MAETGIPALTARCGMFRPLWRVRCGPLSLTDCSPLSVFRKGHEPPRCRYARCHDESQRESQGVLFFGVWPETPAFARFGLLPELVKVKYETQQVRRQIACPAQMIPASIRLHLV